MVFTAEQIANYTGGIVVGDANAQISTFAKIEEGKKGALSFLANMKYEHYLYETESSVVLVNKDFTPQGEVKATLVKVDNAYESVAKLLQMYESMQQKTSGIDSLAFIHSSAKVGERCYVGPFVSIAEGAEIGEGCVIHPHVSIGKNVKIGKNTEIYPNAVVYHDCVIGNNCILHAGCVIGADGFGFAPTPDGYDKIPQIGIVTIEDNVEIGANTCVDRSTMGSTYVRRGAKLDNLVQVAHNCEVGENTVMSSQVGIAGSTKVGKWCMFGGQVGIAGHLSVGDNVQIGAQSGVAGDKLAKRGNCQLMGSPAIDARKWSRNVAVVNNLTSLQQEVQDLKKEIEELKRQKS